MGYMRTDTMHLQCLKAAALAAFAGAASALKWTLTAADSDSLAYLVPGELIDWGVRVRIDLVDATEILIAIVTSASEINDADSHVEQAAIELQLPLSNMLPVVIHYGDALPSIAPGASTLKSGSNSLAEALRHGSGLPSWAAYRPAPFIEWPGDHLAESSSRPFQPSAEEPEPEPWPGPGPGPGPEPEPEPDGGPLGGVATAVLAQKIRDEIEAVEERMKVCGPIERQQLQQKLDHLNSWLSQVEG